MTRRREFTDEEMKVLDIKLKPYLNELNILSIDAELKFLASEGVCRIYQGKEIVFKERLQDYHKLCRKISQWMSWREWQRKVVDALPS